MAILNNPDTIFSNIDFETFKDSTELIKFLSLVHPDNLNPANILNKDLRDLSNAKLAFQNFLHFDSIDLKFNHSELIKGDLIEFQKFRINFKKNNFQLKNIEIKWIKTQLLNEKINSSKDLLYDTIRRSSFGNDAKKLDRRQN